MWSDLQGDFTARGMAGGSSGENPFGLDAMHAREAESEPNKDHGDEDGDASEGGGAVDGSMHSINAGSSTPLNTNTATSPSHAVTHKPVSTPVRAFIVSSSDRLDGVTR